MIADKYNLKDLVYSCAAYLVKIMSMDNALDFTVVAFRIIEPYNLRNVCINYIAENLKLFMKTPKWKEVIATNPEILEAILLKRC